MTFAPLGFESTLSQYVTNSQRMFYDPNNLDSYAGSGVDVTNLFSIPDILTLTNGPTFVSTYSKHFVFDGVNDFAITTVDLGNNPIPTHTMSIWIRTGTVAGHKIMGVENGTIADRHIYMKTDGKVCYGVYDTGYHILTSTNALNNDAWHNIVGVCTGANSIKLYVDGVLNSTTSGNGYNAYGTSKLKIGSFTLDPGGWVGSGGNGYFQGKIGLAQLYTRVLTDDEVLQNYNAIKYLYI